jgi:hypothetical protein
LSDKGFLGLPPVPGCGPLFPILITCFLLIFSYDPDGIAGLLFRRGQFPENLAFFSPDTPRPLLDEILPEIQTAPWGAAQPDASFPIALLHEFVAAFIAVVHHLLMGREVAGAASVRYTPADRISGNTAQDHNRAAIACFHDVPALVSVVGEILRGQMVCRDCFVAARAEKLIPFHLSLLS